MEHRGWVVWYLICEKTLQGLFFLPVGVYLVINRRTFGGAIDGIIDRFNLDVGGGFLRTAAFASLRTVMNQSPAHIVVIGIGAILHALLQLLEGIGLLMRRRWAEYLVVVATGFFIPLEVREVIVGIAEHRHWLVRLVVLVANVAVVAFLVRQKRLFQFEAELPEEDR
jgi:uncharacterized membrane protein (DUF2068 family)